MENEKDKLIQVCDCPICRAKVKLEYDKKITQHSFMPSYTIKVLKGCCHFVEGEMINEQYCRLLNSLLQNRQADYDKLVELRAKRKLQEMGLNEQDLRGLF